MNKLYLITGFQEDINSVNYQNLIKSVEGRYKVEPIDLGLTDPVYTFGKDGTLVEVTDYAKGQIIGDASENVILGFSIGGLIAYQLATQIKFRKVIICSICSILGEDITLYPDEEKNKIFTPKQLEELSSMKYERPLSPLFLFYGSKETEQVIKRSKKLHEKFGGILLEISGVDHDLSKAYLEEVKRVI